MSKFSVIINYTNHRGETRDLLIEPGNIWFGASAFHGGEQWFMRAMDLETKQPRDFAMKDIHSWRPAE